MSDNYPPPPYSASPHIAAPASSHCGSSGATQRESTQHTFNPQPSSSRSSFNPFYSSSPTQANSIQGFSLSPNTEYARAPIMAYSTNQVGTVQPSSPRSGTTQADPIRDFVTSAPTRLSGENQLDRIQPSVSRTPIYPSRPTQTDSIQELTRQPGTYFDAKKNILIRFVPQISVSSASNQPPGSYFDAKKNILIVPKKPAQLTPSFAEQSGVSNSFAVDAPPSFAEAISQVVQRFPKEFGCYKASNLMSDMVVALTGDDPKPLFYISTPSGLSSKPSNILHSDRYPSSLPLATAKYHTNASTIDIELAATSSYPAERHSLEKTGVFSSGRVFSVTLAGSNVFQSFEWKRSHGQEVASLHGRGHGEKLVRLNTGEVVAAWTTPYMSIGK